MINVGKDHNAARYSVLKPQPNSDVFFTIVNDYNINFSNILPK